MTSPLHDIEVETIHGEKQRLDAYKGKVMLIVNTASKCGFTPQFDGLEKLNQEYADRGLAVLGFPCNQFGKQDPGSNEQIESFCKANYGVSFPMHARIEVNGTRAHPLYRLLKAEKPGLLGSTGIKWNFTKFLVDADGRVVERFGPKTKPEELRAKIEALLPS